jgi:hypothetical protein
VVSAGASGLDQKKMVEFAKCMRTHGVPNFPEPTEGKLLVRGGPDSGLDPHSPQFKAAGEACRSLAPRFNVSPAQRAALQEQALKFSACMRSHGVPKFPDPSFSNGEVQLTIGRSGSGIDPRSPQFQEAQKACQRLAPGPKPLAGGPAGP